MKKIRFLLFLIVLLLPFTMVKASGSVARDVVVKEVSGRATADAFDVDQNTITPHIKFYNVDDSVSYAFTLDYDSGLYCIDTVASNNGNKDIKLYTGHSDNSFFMTFYYDSVSRDLLSLQPIELNVRLKAKEVNPNTGSVSFWFVISLYVLLVVFLVSTSETREMGSFLFLLFFIPFMVNAKEFNIIHITIDPSDIKFGYVVHFNSNGGTGTVSDILCVTGEECVVPSDGLESSSGHFVGWGNSSDSQNLFSETDILYGCNDTSLETTFYAIWEYYSRDFDYTGDVQNYHVYLDGQYKLEVWGAEGAGSQSTGNSSSGSGGKGGYSTGIVSLHAGDNLYVYVGGTGDGHPSSVSSSRLSTGGFNGGGSAYGSSYSEPGNGGGGGTDFRINVDSLYARVIVAGGGGGGGEDNGDNVGHGGGTNGTVGGSYGGTAGQTSGGTGGVFGYGASANNDGGGGGGGWYGGGCRDGSQNTPTYASSNDNDGGGGGSGYIYTASTASNYPSGCLLNSSYYLSNASTIAGDQSFASPSGRTETGHSGHGYARITYLG